MQAHKDAQEWMNNQATVDSRAGVSSARGTYRNRRNEWRRPDTGWIKCNVDGSFTNSNIPSRAGWVIRDSRGVYQGAGQGIGQVVRNPLESELQAIIMAMQNCWSHGYKKIIIEGDCQKAIHLLNRIGLCFHSYNWIREALWWKQKFESVEFQWINREGNRVADKLAKSDIFNHSTFCFHHYVPNSITMLLHNDYVISN